MLRPKKRLSKKEIKEDKLVTLYFNAQEFIQQNSKWMLIGAGGIVAIVVISILFASSKRTAERAASAEFIKGRVEYNAGRYENAVDILKSMVDNYSGTNSAKQGMLYLANSFYAMADYDQALEYYDNFARKYKGEDVLIVSAICGSGNCLVAKGDYSAAAEKYMQVIEKYPQSLKAPEALLDAGLAYMEAQNKENAVKAFERLVADYPDAKLKQDAEMYLAQLES